MSHRLLPLLALTAGSQYAAAHEKWFVDPDRADASLAAAFTPPEVWFLVAALSLAALAFVAWRLLGRRGILPGPELFGATADGKAALYGLAPLILGVHLAVPLLIAGVSGVLFSPAVPLDGAPRYLLGLIQTGIALSLFYGGFTRPAAVALFLLWLAGFFLGSPISMLENAHIPGFALFFFLAGRGPYSIDRLLFPRLEPSPALIPYAVPALRIGAGVSFVVVAFTEKLADLPLAMAFLEQYPLNFVPLIGVPLSDTFFILTAGSVELVIGLLLLMGIFVRETIVVAWLPFNLTLTVFNWVELVGHLPFYGIMALLLVWSARDRGLLTAGIAGRARTGIIADV